MELKRKEKVFRHKSKRVKNKHYDTGERVKRKQTKTKNRRTEQTWREKKVKNKQYNRGAQEYKTNKHKEEQD